MRAVLWSVVLLPFLFSSCLIMGRKDKRVVLAKVNNEKILLSEALKSMPGDFKGKDSVNFVQEYLANRIKDILIYEQAEKGVPQNSEIDSMVDNYRRSLIVYEYQQQVLNKKFKSEVGEEYLIKFYTNNISKFSSDQNLVKGLFLKVNKKASKIDKLREWCRKPDSVALDKIETYSVQNAIIYNCFMEKWTGLEEVVGNMPLVSQNPSAYLKSGGTVETEDGEFCYLLYVKDCIFRGSPAPFEYIKPLVISVMMNTNKTDFLRQYEQDMLENAVKKGKVTYY